MRFTTEKFTLVSCEGRNGPYVVRVPAGTVLEVVGKMDEPIDMVGKHIRKDTYLKYYAPPVQEEAEAPKKETKSSTKKKI